MCVCVCFKTVLYPSDQFKPNIRRSLVWPHTVWAGSSGQIRSKMNLCLLLKRVPVRYDAEITAKHYVLVPSNTEFSSLFLSHSLASHTHTNRQAQIKQDIHVHTHAHACHPPFRLKMDSGRVCCYRVCLWVCVCVTLSLGCVCGRCCRLVRYVNGKRDVGNAFIQTPRTRTLIHIHMQI